MAENTDLATSADDDDDIDIRIEVKPTKRLKLDLGGTLYLVKPPKATLAMVLAKKMSSKGGDLDSMMKALGDWLTIAMGPKEAKKVLARLDDADDDLDLAHVMELIEKLTERTTGNPTT